MVVRPPLRIAVALAAAILFVPALAYWWQGNLFHEIVGTIFLALLILHNAAVIGWYAAVGKGRWSARRAYSTAVNAAILVLMTALLVTSLMVSQTLFTALPINIGFSARGVHVLVAYWALVVMGLHLGLHWSRVMAAGRRIVALPDTATSKIVARLLALAIAAFGLQSIWVMLLAEKLMNIPALEMWDFTADAGGFLLRYASIVGLFACIGHYLAAALQSLRELRPS